MGDFIKSLNDEPVVQEFCTKCGIDRLTIADLVEYIF